MTGENYVNHLELSKKNLGIYDLDASELVNSTWGSVMKAAVCEVIAQEQLAAAKARFEVTNNPSDRAEMDAFADAYFILHSLVNSQNNPARKARPIP